MVLGPTPETTLRPASIVSEGTDQCPTTLRGPLLHHSTQDAILDILFNYLL